ncbi:hypothetical protein GCG54_00014022 [Colletotrichum gloeosporioides]|uniref:DUF6546 domain-containing protein n=1 Tax=Colletotrichum gloeosporioides TaxID=474922 RepID=A0A8H4CFD1_COLGL|nr:uncharacterized protein GCG54_00014022 [Colletotrichum gloeosporioides]KAF3802786.1 hypothetical protein GCG54_00014022 [Colletotrichum gloeosporioides]
MLPMSPQKQHWSSWNRLPREIRLLILHEPMRAGCSQGHLATVSREWQIEIERHNFARIRLTPSRLVNFGALIQRNQALVSYIWFCLELDDYDCTTCAPDGTRLTLEEWGEACEISDTDKCPITAAFRDLFLILSTWDFRPDLILDISIYSPSDSEHCFPYLTFMPDTPSNMSSGYGIEKARSSRHYHDPQHGWVAGFRHAAPPRYAIRKVFHSVMERGPFDSDQLELQWWDQLPTFPAVTGLLLRQQNRRLWKPPSLAHMFARFPRLKDIHYQPWREWDFPQHITDKDYQYLFESIRLFNSSLKRLVVFENFNQQYPATMQRFLNGVDLTQCDSLRKPDSAVSRIVALASLKLEQLAASFIVDASSFFEVQPSWEWPSLTSLTLTSRLLTPDGDLVEIEAMLQKAAAAAMKMPQLGLAALFRYQAFRNIPQAVVLWRGTWKFAMKPSITQTWEAVIHQYNGWRLDFVEEQLNETTIKSHGHAVQHLMHATQIICPVSLRQIQTEQKALGA